MVGAAAIRGAVSSFKELAQSADEVGKASQRIGIGAEALQTLTFAAEQSGVEFDTLEKSLRKLTLNLGDFERGTGEAADAFEALGFSAKDFRGQGLDQSLLLLADRFAVMATSSAKAELAAKVFGERIGTQLIPFLNEGSEGIKRLQDEAKRLGGVFSDDLIVASTQFNDNLDKINKAIEGLKIKALGPLIKDLADVTNAFTAASTAALTFGEKMNLIFSGNVNIGRFVELQEKLAALNKELSESGGVERSALGSLLSGKRGANFIQSDIDDVERELASIQKLSAARTALATETTRPTPGTRQAPAIIDRKASDAAARAEAALIETRSKLIAAGEQRLAETRLELLERFHAEGLIAEDEFWARRLDIQLEANDASLKAANEEVRIRERGLAAAQKKGPRSAEAFTAEKELLEAVTRRNQIEEDSANASVKAFLDSARAAQSYKDEITNISAELLTIQDRTSEAVKLTTELEQRTLRRRAGALGDTQTVNELNAIRDARVAQADFNQARQRGQEILRQLAVDEERIQNSRRVGAIGELEALSQTDDARRASAERLKTISDQLSGIASTSGIPELTRQAEEFGAQLETLVSQSNLLFDKVRGIGETGLGDFFSDIITGSKSAKDAFADFAKSVGDQLARLASQEVARVLVQGAVGGAGGGSGGQIGGIIGAVLSLWAGGGGGGGLNLSSYGPAFAAGGAMTMPGQPFVVGEKGPELFVAPSRGQIVPSGQFGSQNVQVNVAVQGSTDARTAGQIGAEASRALRRASRRNG